MEYFFRFWNIFFSVFKRYGRKHFRMTLFLDLWISWTLFNTFTNLRQILLLRKKMNKYIIYLWFEYKDILLFFFLIVWMSIIGNIGEHSHKCLWHKRIILYFVMSTYTLVHACVMARIHTADVPSIFYARRISVAAVRTWVSRSIRLSKPQALVRRLQTNESPGVFVDNSVCSMTSNNAVCTPTDAALQ